MNAIDYFRTQGGVKLLRQWWKNGVFGTALGEFAILGKSKTALEILRIAVNWKTSKLLEKKYRKVLDEQDFSMQGDDFGESPKRVWVMWWQGIKEAPDIVKMCVESIKRTFIDWQVVVLDGHNYTDYVSVPESIVAKMKDGVIPLAHFSDILRLELLVKYGGLWIDSTVYCSVGRVKITPPLNNLVSHRLFAFRNIGDGSEKVEEYNISNWFIYAHPNHEILIATLRLLYQYWEDVDELTDYFVFHKFFKMVCKKYPEEAREIPMFSNALPHILQLHLFDVYNEDYWNDLTKQCAIHKLTYKLDVNNIRKSDTYYHYIMSGNNEKANV